MAINGIETAKVQVSAETSKYSVPFSDMIAIDVRFMAVKKVMRLAVQVVITFRKTDQL